MVSRRIFLQSSSGALATVALPYAALANTNAALLNAQEVSESRGIPLSLRGVRPGSQVALLRSIRDSSACSTAAAESIDLSWAIDGGQQWRGDSLIVHTRYTPAHAGAALDWQDGGLTQSSRFDAFERYRPQRNALALAVEPYAILINNRKASSLGGGDPRTLTALERRGKRALFVLSDWHDTGETGWALPLLAHHLPLTQDNGRAASMFLSSATLRGLEEIKYGFFDRVDTHVQPLAPNDESYVRLLDMADEETAAIYGNPAKLAQMLQAAGQAGLAKQFTQVSLSEFLGYELPALPRLQSFQFGAHVDHPAAMEVAQSIVEVLGSDSASLFHGCDALECATAEIMGNAYDFAHYEKLPHLEFLTDGAFAARVLTQLNQTIAGDERSKHVIRTTAANAFHGWSQLTRMPDRTRLA